MHTHQLYGMLEFHNYGGPEQKRRKNDVVAIQVNVKWNVPIPSDKKNFLCSKKNKQHLIDLCSPELAK